jgi:MoaA/NifB/PqqE/SkfB family radical SAM enzyme
VTNKITEDTHGQLSCLNWATLSDHRAAEVRPEQELRRVALIVTGKCNFACPYCKTLGGDRAPTMDQKATFELLREFRKQGLRELRISGGEPTTVPWLRELVREVRTIRPELGSNRVPRIAISTNGYAPTWVYRTLIGNGWSGVNEFSVSLDTMDPTEADRLAGGRPNVLARVTDSIRAMATAGANVYIGMTCCGSKQTPSEMRETVEAAAALGVTDVKIMSPAQEGTILDTSWMTSDLAERFPFLAWRSRNFQRGRDVRGLTERDSHKCPLVLDDATIAGDKHYPCNVYFREGGAAIGTVGPKMLADRAAWYAQHDTHQDAICRTMCMDLLRTYNNRVQELNPHV